MFAELDDGFPSLSLEDEDEPVRVKEFKKQFRFKNEHPIFVGRRQERETLKQRLKLASSVVSICGPPLVGKSRLAKQIFLELLQESLDLNVSLRTFYMNLEDDNQALSEYASKSSILLQRIIRSTSTGLSEYGGRECTVDDVIVHINQMCKPNGMKTYCLLLVDNCDGLLESTESRKEFVNVCVLLAKNCKYVRIVTTSRFRINLARRLGEKHYCKPVSTLCVESAVDLLRAVAPNVDFGVSYAEELVTHCCSLPSVVRVVGQMLEERKQLFTPAEACDLFKSKSLLEFLDAQVFVDDEDMHEKIVTSFKIVSEHLQEFWAALSFVSGNFSANVARAILKSESIAEVKEGALIPLVDRSLLEYSEDTKTFFMYPFLRTIASEVMTEIASSDPVREGFVHYFGKCLLEINKQCLTRSYTAVSSEHAHEMDNVRQLLTEAVNCTEAVYPIYYKVGKEAFHYLSLVAPYESIKFYNACRESAKKFGTREEESQMLTNYGDLSLEHTRARADECQQVFNEAGSLLENYPDSDVRSSLLVKESWLYYRTGDYQKAVECCRRALDIETRCGRSYSRLVTQINSIAGICLNMQGKFVEAERHLKEALEMRKQMNPLHPSVAVALNNLGGLYTKWGKCKKGLDYSKASLLIRRQHHKEPHNDVARALVSVAYQVLRHHGPSGADEALGYLEEALNLRKKLCYNHQNTAYVLYYMADSYAYKKQHDLAIAYYTESLKIHERCLGKFSYFSEKVNIKIGCIFQETGELEKAAFFLAPLLSDEKRNEIITREPKYEMIPKAALAMCKVQAQLRTGDCDYRRILSQEVDRLSALYLRDGDEDNLKALRETYGEYLDTTGD